MERLVNFCSTLAAHAQSAQSVKPSKGTQRPFAIGQAFRVTVRRSVSSALRFLAGAASQCIPVPGTSKIPVGAARSLIRGRPPFGTVYVLEGERR